MYNRCAILLIQILWITWFEADGVYNIKLNGATTFFLESILLNTSSKSNLICYTIFLMFKSSLIVLFRVRYCRSEGPQVISGQALRLGKFFFYLETRNILLKLWTRDVVSPFTCLFKFANLSIFFQHIIDIGEFQIELKKLDYLFRKAYVSWWRRKSLQTQEHVRSECSTWWDGYQLIYQNIWTNRFLSMYIFISIHTLALT